MDLLARRFQYTHHAELRLEERAIDKLEVEFAFEKATIIYPDRIPGRYNLVAEMAFGKRLRVVYKEKESGITLIITVIWLGD